MKKRIFGLFMAAWCISSLVIAGSPMRTLAADSSNSGGDVSINGDHSLTIPEGSIINAKLMPGTSVTQKFQVKNSASQSVTIYMSSNMEVTDVSGAAIQTVEGKSFSKDLISKLQLVITDDTGKLVYSGPCSGKSADASDEFKAAYQPATITEGFFQTAADTKGICLGAIPAGSSLTLTAVVTMDGASIGNDYQNTYGLFNWNFYCEGEDPIIIPPTPTPGGDDPDTPPTEPTEPTDPGEEIPDPIVPGTGGDTDDGNTDIDDDKTPTTPITITDNDVPEGDTLAHTGFKVVYLKEAGIVLAVLVVALVIVSRKQKRKQSNK